MNQRVAARPQSPAVLIVEDEPLIAMALEGTLQDAGYRVLGVAASEDEAIDLAARGKIDCAILDVQLRDGTSAALARRLRAAGVPFLVITGLRPQDIADPLLRAVPILRKPFSIDDLLEPLHRLVGDRMAVVRAREPALSDP